MGASIPPSRSRGLRSRPPMSEINVTPMVDVMLVLLVIFMISAPLMNSGVPVDLPSHTAPSLQEKEEPITLTLTKKKELFLGNDLLSLEGLTDALHQATHENMQARIYLRADQSLSYGVVMSLMDSVRKAGYTKVALVSEPEKTPLTMR